MPIKLPLYVLVRFTAVEPDPKVNVAPLPRGSVWIVPRTSAPHRIGVLFVQKNWKATEEALAASPFVLGFDVAESL